MSETTLARKLVPAVASRIVIVVYMLVLNACVPERVPIPRNAQSPDREIITRIRPHVEHASWNANGRVERISICGDVAREELYAIAELRDLKELSILGKIDVEFARRLKKLSKLTALGLAWCELEKGTVAEIVELENLELLALTGTNVNDSDALMLLEKKNLRWLFLDKTNISRATAQRLKRELPDCHVKIPKKTRPTQESRASE